MQYAVLNNKNIMSLNNTTMLWTVFMLAKKKCKMIVPIDVPENTFFV